MNYRNCKILCILQHKDEPLVSKIPCDEYTQLAQSYFDYEFMGESKFYPYRLPKVLNDIDYRICVITGASGKGKSQLLKEFSLLQTFSNFPFLKLNCLL